MNEMSKKVVSETLTAAKPTLTAVRNYSGKEGAPATRPCLPDGLWNGWQTWHEQAHPCGVVEVE